MILRLPFSRRVVCCLMLLSLPVFAGLPYAWVELGPDGAHVRVITKDKACPTVMVDGAAKAMQPRVASPIDGFEVNVCELKVPDNVASLKIGDKPLPVPTPDPKNIVVVGDTGCRMKHDTIQDCTGKGDGAPWRWAEVAATAASQKPDLIVHVGDYLYRERPCPPGNKNCEGSPYGDNWATWDADFFTPVGDLLDAAPWIFVRGNHEDCTRAWKGWFLFLDPMPVTTATFAGCPEHPDPYLVGFKDINVAVIDTSVIPNAYNDPPDQPTVDILAKQLTEVNKMVAGKQAWTATHRPYWGLSTYDDDGVVKMSAVSIALRAALDKIGGLSPNIEMALAGHIHQFEVLRFDDGRPLQIVAGASGTELDPPITPELVKENAAIFKDLELNPDDFIVKDNYNFLVIRPGETVWKMTLFDYQGKVEGRYSSPRK